MKIRAVFSCLSLLLALLLLLTGCSGKRPAAPDETDTPETDVEIDAPNKEEVEYRLVIDSVDYITEEEKEAWRPHLIRRLSYIEGLSDENLPEGEYAIENGQFYALFDLDLDGVPEILTGFLNFGSGFATTYPYFFSSAYDLYTGRQVGADHFSVCNNLAVFYNEEKGTYEVYSMDHEFSNFRSEHSYGGTFFIERVEKLYEHTWFPGEGFPSETAVPHFVTTQYLSTDLSTKGMFSAETVAETERAEELHRYVTVYHDPSFIYDGEPCEYHEFYGELLHFMNTRIRLSETQLQYVRTRFRDELARSQDIPAIAEALADELLSLDQQFVRPIQREERPGEEASP